MRLQPGQWYAVDGSRCRFVRAQRCSARLFKEAGCLQADPLGTTMFFFTSGRGEFVTDDISTVTAAQQQLPAAAR